MSVRPWKAIRFAALLVTAITLLTTTIASADEIIIEESNSTEEISIGDFNCSPCLVRIGAASYPVRCGKNPSVQMEAGELWKFFDEHGMKSVDELRFFVDIDQISDSSSFDLEGLKVQIQNPNEPTLLLTDTTMGEDSLVIPGYETSSSKPEAKIRLALGYDFMKEFSSTSTEQVLFNFSPSQSSMSPTFVLASDESVFSNDHAGVLFGFIIFWGLVFLGVNRFIKPSEANEPGYKAPVNSVLAESVIAK